MVHELPIIFLFHPTHFFSNKDGLVMGCLFGASEQRSLFFFSLVSSVRLEKDSVSSCVSYVSMVHLAILGSMFHV
jgi:hypothetical protein